MYGNWLEEYCISGPQLSGLHLQQLYRRAVHRGHILVNLRLSVGAGFSALGARPSSSWQLQPKTQELSFANPEW